MSEQVRSLFTKGLNTVGNTNLPWGPLKFIVNADKMVCTNLSICLNVCNPGLHCLSQNIPSECI